MWTQDSIHALVEKQNAYFRKGDTLDVSWRIEQLKKLKYAVMANTEKLQKALVADLARTNEEAYFCDIGPVVMEINETIAGLRRWARPETHFSGFVCFPSMVTKVYKMPYGTTLIISPFNFPVMLSFGVLAAAIAGGNTAIIKASSKSPTCTKTMQEIIAATFGVW